MWGPDPSPIPIKDARRQFLMAVAGFITFGFFVKAITPEPPVIRREYPFDGLVKELGGVEENKVLSICTVISNLPFMYSWLGTARKSR